MENLTETVAEFSKNVNQLSAAMAQIKETLVRMETWIANLETNRRADNHRDDGENIWNQRDQTVNNIDRDLRIKLVIPKYDGKLKPDEFMDRWVCVENIFAHKPMIDCQIVTLVATWFRSYAAI